MAKKVDSINQIDLTASLLTTDVQILVRTKGQIKGIPKERMSDLIQRDFITAQQYEIIFICNALGMYLFEFEQKYNYTFNL